MPGASYMLLNPFNTPTGMQCNDTHFLGRETEAQRGKAMPPFCIVLAITVVNLRGWVDSEGRLRRFEP